MKAQLAGLSVGILIFAGCASGNRGGLATQDTLNEPSDRFAALEDRRPPNPNRPIDNRELKAAPTVIQKDPALDKAPADRGDKGLAVNAGPDQLVRPQDPTQTPGAPNAAGGPAGQQQDSATSADTDLATRVKEALATARKADSNTDPTLASKQTNGERKGLPNVDVTAKNGRVTMSGTVASDAERSAFEQAASRVTGVTSVNNYLTVTKPDKQ
jgi:hypothetical protein